MRDAVVRVLRSPTLCCLAAAAILFHAGHANAAERASVLVILPTHQAAALSDFQQRFFREMKERRVSDADLAAIRYLLTSQEPDALARTVRSLSVDAAKVVYASTFLILKALVAQADRPPVVFYANMSKLTERVPELADRARARATGVDGWVQLESKMLEMLQLAKPLLRTACVVSSSSIVAQGSFEWLEQFAAGLGLAIKYVTIDGIAQLRAAVQAKSFAPCDGLLVFIHEPLMLHPREYIAQVNDLDVPAVYASTNLGPYGALITVDADGRKVLKHMYDQIAAILSGVPVENLPIARPDSFVIGVNVRSAQRLTRSLDKRVILRANEFYYER